MDTSKLTVIGLVLTFAVLAFAGAVPGQLHSQPERWSPQKNSRARHVTVQIQHSGDPGFGRDSKNHGVQESAGESDTWPRAEQNNSRMPTQT